MITRSCLIVLACCSYLLMIQTFLPRTIALRITPNVDEFMIENHRTRTRTRQDYRIQRALDDELLANLDNLADLAPMIDDTEASPEGQSSQDYANKMRNDMIRKDIIFLDNSVETTTRERGNIRKKNVERRAPPCSCESNKTMIPLGEDYYPKWLESRNCSGSCLPPYHCKAVHYCVPILKKVKTHRSRISTVHVTDGILEVPTDFHPLWVPDRYNVTTSCVCISES